MLSNAYFLAKFRFDTAENEPAQNLQNFANFPNFANPNPQQDPRKVAPTLDASTARTPRRMSHAEVPQLASDAAQTTLWMSKF